MRIAIHKQSGQPLSDSDGDVLVFGSEPEADRWLSAHDAQDAYEIKPARSTTVLELLEVDQWIARRSADAQGVAARD